MSQRVWPLRGLQVGEVEVCIKALSAAQSHFFGRIFSSVAKVTVIADPTASESKQTPGQPGH